MFKTRKPRSVKASEQGQRKLEQAKGSKRTEDGKRWSYFNVAEAAGIKDEKTVRSFFDGKPVDKTTANAICQALGLTLEEIIDVEVTSLSSSLYIERPPTEDECYKAIVQPGALIRIKAPQQMGKTSLMSKVMKYADNQNYRTVNINLRDTVPEDFSNLDSFLKWFCNNVAEQFEISTSVDEHWHNGSSNGKIKCKKFFSKNFLKEDEPLTVALDEVDRVYRHREIAGEFLGMLRTWHEEAKVRPIWEKYRQLVLHTEIYVDMDINQSPFNAGVEIKLVDFSAEEILALTKEYDLNWNYTEVNKLMSVIGGHPFLADQAFRQLKVQNLTLEDLIQTVAMPNSIYKNHLESHWKKIKSEAESVAVFKTLVTTDNSVNALTEQEFNIAVKLEEYGLLKLDNNVVKPRYELYRQYFRQRFKDI